MSLFFVLPESQAFKPAPVHQHMSCDGYVDRRMQRIGQCLEALKAPPLTDQERAEHASKVAAVRYRDEMNQKDLLSQ